MTRIYNVYTFASLDVIFEPQGQIFEWDPEKAAANLRKHDVSFSHEQDIIRIISARPATPSERRDYEHD